MSNDESKIYKWKKFLDKFDMNTFLFYQFLFFICNKVLYDLLS